MSKTEITPEVAGQLMRFARRLEENPDFMAWVLAVYRKQEHLDDSALAEQLGASDAALARLALCKRPSSAAPQFAEQVRQISTYTQIDAAQLATILRQVESLEQLSKQPRPRDAKDVIAQQKSLASGLLAAARDREELEEEQAESPDTSDTSKTE